MANIEKTLVLVKPDGVKKHICGEVISRFERKGLSIHAIKMIQVPVELAEEHYAEHKGKGFFKALIDFITSGPYWLWSSKVKTLSQLFVRSTALPTRSKLFLAPSAATSLLPSMKMLSMLPMQ